MVTGVSTEEYIQEAYRYTEARVNGDNGAGGIRSGEDSVDLSQESVSLAQSILPDVETEPGLIRLADIEQQIAVDKKHVGEKLEALLEKLGIDRNVSFTLGSTSTGSITVEGDFEGKEALEAAINNDEALRNTYTRMSANSSLLDAARRAEEFRQAYAENPGAAVVRYSYLFNDDTEYHVTVNYSGGEIDIAVNMTRNA